MNGNRTKLETERKYLIALPDTAALMALPGAYKEDMEQIYLFKKDGASRRVRKSVRDGKVTYVYNEKSPVSAASMLETEQYLDKKEYERYKQEADPDRRAIYKTRYTVPDCGFVYEIDIYSFSVGRAVLEVELDDETIHPPIPPYLTLIREVTGEKVFSNRAIAKEIPPELKE